MKCTLKNCLNIPSSLIGFILNFFHPHAKSGKKAPSEKQLTQKHDVFLMATYPSIPLTGMTAGSVMVSSTDWRFPKLSMEVWASEHCSFKVNRFLMLFFPFVPASTERNRQRLGLWPSVVLQLHPPFFSWFLRPHYRDLFYGRPQNNARMLESQTPRAGLECEISSCFYTVR